MLELRAYFIKPAKLFEQIAAHAWEEVLGLEQRLGR